MKKVVSVLIAAMVLVQSAFVAAPFSYVQAASSTTQTASKTTALKITKQPVSVAVVKGKTAKVALTAKGDGLKYKWYFKDKGASKFSLTNSFKGASYSVSMSAARNGRQVYCVVTDKYGKTVKSKTATLTMATALKITKQPQAVIVMKGKTAKVTLTAKGDGLKYKWYFKDKGASKFKLTTTFKSTSYSVAMSAARDGRQVYCVVTDKYGKTVQSDTVKLSMCKTLKISKQPQNVSVLSGSNAKVTVTAKGEGLKYKWYFKDKGASKFSVTNTFKGTSYSVSMNAARNGRQIYCVVTDKHGCSVKTNTVTLTMGKTLAITEQPVSVTAKMGTVAKVSFTAVGDGLTYKWYFKDAGASKFTVTNTFKGNTYSAEMNAVRNGREIYCVVTDQYGKTVQTDTVKLIAAHEMGEWELYREATVEEEGVERRYCQNCTYYEDRAVDKLVAIYTITGELGFGDPYRVGVAENGKYTLKTPTKVGYVFDHWEDVDGNVFEPTGLIYQDITIYAKWTLDGTDTLQELIERTNAGVDKIVITADITVNTPLFVSYNTAVYADEDHTILRAPNYSGDLFVVGQTANGVSSILLGREAVLTLGGGAGTLTLDGNKDNTTVTVNGSAVFVTESAVLNLYDGVRIQNNEKLGNDRSLHYAHEGSEYAYERAGGAAILNLNSTVHMYGGVIDNNHVAKEHTVEVDETGAEVKTEDNGCGGAVYNSGNFYMYGGVISNNEGLRGGALYNNRVMHLYAGTVSNNTSYLYGGAVSTSSSMNADLFIGSEGDNDDIVFENNHSNSAGGAFYSNTSSPIVIYGNAAFINNSTDTSGGAIYTAGPLTVRGAVFDGNHCVYSGGAIYHHYTKAEFNRRYMELTDCEFKNNRGNLGGAVILSASSTVSETGEGTSATITDCDFSNNAAVSTETANGNGGALYITRMSDAAISGCTFTDNRADVNAGAVAMHSESSITMEDCEFIGNSAVYGGAAYVSSNAALTMKNVSFTSNTAVLDKNSKNGHGGALFMSAVSIDFDNVDFYGNTAANNGGAVYQNACTTEFDATCEFEANTAGGHGGVAYLTYTTLEDGTKNGSVLNAKDVSFKNNTASAGGAISIRTACKANIEGGSFVNNTATGTENDASGGGAIYVGFGELTLNNVTATGNTSGGHGGVVNAVASTVVVENGTFTDNAAPSGGAFNALSKSTLTFNGSTLLNNASTYVNSDYNNSLGGGAINISGGSLTVQGVTLDGNTSNYYGGALLAVNCQVTMNGDSVVKNSDGATGAALYFRSGCAVTLENIDVTENVSDGNGVVYVNGSTLTMKDVAVTDNSAKNGGALYCSGGTTVVTAEQCSFVNNHATSGGVVYADSATVTVSDCEISDNSATNGGVVYSNSALLTLETMTLNNNTVTGAGGAVYASYGDVTFKDLIFTANSASGNGGAAYIKFAPVSIANVQFTQNTAGSNGGAMDLVASEVTIEENCVFTGNSAVNHGGALYVVYAKAEGATESTPCVVTIVGGSFDKNTALGGGAISVRSGCDVTVDSTVFTENSVEGFTPNAEGTGNDGDGEGGGAFYVGYGTLTLNTVTATGNTASDFGGFVDAAGATVTVNGGTFSKNTTKTGGALFATNGSKVTINGASFAENQSIYDTEVNATIGGGAIAVKKSTLDISATTFDNNDTDYYGGTIYASASTVTIDDNTSITNSDGATGAAIYFREGSKATMTNVTLTGNTSTANGVVYVNNGTLTMTNVAASNNSGYNSAVLFSSGGSTVATVDNCVWNNNTATNGGAIHTTGGTVNVQNSQFTENAATLGGAVYLSSAIVNVSDSTFTKNTAVKNGGAITFSSGEMYATGNNVFDGNTAEGHGGAVYVAYKNNESDGSKIPGVLTMNGGLFQNNQALAGGAVSVRTECELYLTDTVIKNNSALGKNNNEGGGAVYANNNTVVLSGVVMDSNTSAYYGGAVSVLGVNLTVKDNTQFKNNAAVTGCAVQMRDQGTHTFENVEVIGNTASANGSGVVYITGNGTLSIQSMIAKNNTNNNGGVVYISGSAKTEIRDSEFSGNTALNFGGAIDHRSSGTLTVTDTVIESNTAKNGGAMYAAGAGAVMLTDCTLKSNSATQKGGAIYATGAANITVSGTTLFEENTATSAGAVYLDQGATMNVSGATFDGNTATSGDGGAIVVADSSEAGTAATTLIVSGATFKNNTSSAKGGAIATDTASPNLVLKVSETTFEKNSALGAGGGAVEIQCGNQTTATDPQVVNIVLTNCTFDGNTAKTTGAGVEIRTSSCAKIDGITATNNAATDNGGVVYVTSNFSRLYLTGTVTISGNTAKNGPFAYLYKTSSYSNPPKIYTTHSNTAAWCAEVAGNSTNIDFDLDVLP